MAYEPCRYAKRWPDVWASLPTDGDRQHMSQSLAEGRLDGHEPNREYVEQLAQLYRGEIPTAEFLDRALAEVRRAKDNGEPAPPWMPKLEARSEARPSAQVPDEAAAASIAEGWRQTLDAAKKRLGPPAP